MRILFVSSGLGYGGAETQLIALARELARQGQQVALYLLTKHVPRLDELDDSGVEIRRDDKKRKLDLSVLSRLRRFIKAWRPDVIHGFLFDGNVYSRIAAFGCGAVVLNAERSDAYSFTALQKIIHWPTRKWADGIVANSYSGAAHAGRLFGLPPARQHVVWNGVDQPALRQRSPARKILAEFFPSSQVPVEEARIATLVGTINMPKDHLLALEVAEVLCKQDPRWHVLFVGASFGSKLSYATEIAQLSNLHEERVMARWQGMADRERIVFTGQRSDATSLMASSDVLFSTSALEGFPNVVLEAMVLGIPVVATEFSDIRRILPRPWQVVASRSPSELAQAVFRACELREELAIEQQRWAAEHCTIEMAAARSLLIYQSHLTAN